MSPGALPVEVGGGLEGHLTGVIKREIDWITMLLHN